MITSNEVAIKELKLSHAGSYSGNFFEKGTALLWQPSRIGQSGRNTEFLFAAKLWSECIHPNLVKVLDWFEENESAYVVMEFIRGETLSSVIERERKLSESQVKDYLLQISNALITVHTKGILHRDINPHSIMINQHGKPVIIDFDIAREFIKTTQKVSNFVTFPYAPLGTGHLRREI